MFKQNLIIRKYGMNGGIAHAISEIQNGMRKKDVNKLRNE